MTYFDTTSLEGADLNRAKLKAKSQEARIQAFFNGVGRIEFTPVVGNPGFTPDNILAMVFHDSIPITSVRRAMTNLTSAGYLEKTDEMRPGLYGKQTHCWRLAGPKTGHVQVELF